MKLLHLLKLDFLPKSSDLGLLVLRVWIGLSMLLLHGAGKVANFSTLSEKFSDPLGVGSPTVSLLLAILAEAVGSIFLALGLFTRFAAVGGIITMSVAAFVVHGGPKEGELAFIYLAAYATLFVAGGGRFSLDSKVR